MTHTCFLCTGETQANNFSNSDENFILLGQILEIPNLKNNLMTINKISYCPGCLDRILSIRDMLVELERLEKKVMDEKYLIENQLKEYSRKQNNETKTQNNCPTDELRIKVGAELMTKTIRSMLKKIHKRQFDREQCPQRPVRILKDVTIPKIPTLENGKNHQDSIVPVQVECTASEGKVGFLCHESPINYDGCVPMENCLEDPLQINTWTDSAANGYVDIKYERNSYQVDASNVHVVDHIVEPSEFTASTSTESPSNFIKSEIGLTKCTDVQGKDEGSANTKTYICGTCGVSFDRYNQLLIHDRVHMKAGGSTKNTNGPKIKNNNANSKPREQKQNVKVSPSQRPKKCDDCGRILSSLKTWRDHVMQVHRKEHKFKCTFCDYGCQVKSELERHKLIHSDVKTFKCHLCQSAFHQKRALNRHFKSHK